MGRDDRAAGAAWPVVAAAFAASAALLSLAVAALATGRLTLDLALGRRVRPLGPLTVRIAAPRELIYAQLAVAYRSLHPPRDLREKVEILERGGDMVIAAHRTRVGRLTTVTVESVAFAPPEEIRFRLLRGPVPYVRERFLLREEDGATELEYTGELGTDLWGIGARWGALVAMQWERAVSASLRSLKGSAEASAARAAARAAR